MFGFLVRAIGVLFLAGGFAAFVIDGSRTIAASRLIVTSFGETCLQMFPRLFPLLQPAVERRLHPLVWDPFLLAVFLLPTAFVFAAFGLLLLWLARRRESQPLWSA
ncbi:MAG: hypothetical protein ACO27F_13370 [Beijerinckiaceae bacterium]|jgi:hypothetical protein